MPAGKVTVNESNPDSWSPPLEYKAVAWDSLHHELIGEDEEVAPEDAGEGPQPDSVVSMGPDNTEPGPSAPPTFATVTGPSSQNIAPPPRNMGVGPGFTIPSAYVESLRARLKRRDPAAIRVLGRLQASARTDPKAAAMIRALMMKPIAGPVFSGEIPNSLVTNTISKILNLALTPVVWAAQGTGAIVSEAGNLLESLSKKL